MSQTLDKKKLDLFFAELEKHDEIKGSVALVKKGELLYTNAIGEILNDGKMSIDATPESPYRIGSVTKTFTSALVFQLIDEGKLTLDVKLDKFFPKVVNSGKITIAHLLNHTSGLFSITSRPDYLEYYLSKQSKKKMLNRIYSLTANFEPGKKYEYSNTNYILLGYIIESVCKKNYGKVLDERIVQKLGLKNTFFASNKKVSSFTYEKDWVVQPPTDMSVPHGAGAILSTPTDIAKFIDLLFRGKVVSEKSLSKMKEMSAPDYNGMGLFIFPFNEKRGLGHSGAIDAFHTILIYFEKDELAIAFCTNGERYELNDAMIGILSIYFGRPFEVPDFEAMKKTDPELEKYLGLYTSKQIPLKITIKNKGKQLFGQASGQSEFPLTQIGEHTFKFDAAGVEMVFDPEKNGMIMKQNGKEFSYIKE